MFLFSCEERKNFFLGMSLKSKFPIGILSGLLRFYPFKGIQYKHVCPQRCVCVCVFYYVRKKTGVRHRVCRLVRNFPDSRKLLNHTAEYLYESVCERVWVCVFVCGGKLLKVDCITYQRQKTCGFHEAYAADRCWCVCAYVCEAIVLMTWLIWL